MITKKINADLPQETEDNVIQNLQAVGDSLPFMLELTKEERIGISKLGRKRIDFMERALRYAKANPQFVPSYLDVAAFEQDVTLRSQLYLIHDLTQKMNKKMKDTLLVLEAEAYEASRVFYASVKTAAQKGEDGAEILAKDLYFHYKKSPSTDTATTSELPSEPTATSTKAA